MSAARILSSSPTRWKAQSRSLAAFANGRWGGRGALEERRGIREWQVEWKWDGIRAQLIRRSGRTFVWSRGEELMTDRFPELAALGAQLPEGLVVDGEVLPWKNGEPLPFAQLQRRIGRKLLGPRILSEVPVVIVAYDLLELHGEDIRERPLEFRRAHLE